MSDPETTAVTAQVRDVRFVSPDGVFAVVSLQVEDQGEVTAVGSLGGVRPGELIRAHGRWEDDARFGRQLRVESYVPTTPASLEGLRRYLGSGIVEGIGPVLAERLVDRFGKETVDVLSRQPERLTEVEGVGPKRRDRIVEAWSSMTELRDVMLFLQSHGLNAQQAARVHRAWGRDAIAKIRVDPYRLAHEIRGVGFRTADAIARAVGVDTDAPVRLDAGVLHALAAATEDGHVFLPQPELLERAAALLDQPAERLGPSLDRLALAGRVVREEAGVFPAGLHRAELRLAGRLAAVRDAARPADATEVRAAIEGFETRFGLTLAEAQRDAVRVAGRAKLMVLTGGPGTGKTTVVRAILDLLERGGRRVHLAAPTGRAAKRLAEATDRSASTLHRLLEYSPKADGFTRNREQPLETDAVIVDEASMIDLLLATHLLEAIPDHARLLLVGDVDQLPPVGAGDVLRDVIRSGAADVVRLERIFRQEGASWIVDNAHRVRTGQRPRSAPSAAGDFFLVERDSPEDVARTVEHLITERIPKAFGLDPLEDVQVLTPMRRGVLGSEALNERLQARLNPSGDTLLRGSQRLRVGDRVMQTRNDYEREVFNGDLGRVQALDAEARRLIVRFDERDVRYELAELDALVLAWATTIHKSQGSEYPAVVVPLHTQHFVMLRRNLLYTAITRGRRLVVVVGNARALALSVANDRVELRHTRLAERLRGAAPEAPGPSEAAPEAEP